MSYLVRCVFGLKEVEKYEEVISLLRKSTAVWCANWYADEDGEGKDFETLYQKCFKNKDFGDIAQVYEVDTYFKITRGKVPGGLYLAERKTDFKLRRIF